MTIKIEFPAENVKLAALFGEMLTKYAAEVTVYDEKPQERKKEPTPSQKAFAPKEPTPSIFEKPAPVEEPEPEIEVIKDPEPTVKTDAHGVVFDEKYCSDTQVKSGKNKGQWKPSDEVSPAEFRRWYAAQLPEQTEEVKPVKRARKTVSESGRKVGPVSPPVGQPEIVREEKVPTDCAELMAWISDRQALGYLTHEDFQNACTQFKLTVRDLFPPVPANEIKESVHKLYTFLKELCDD